MVGARCDDIAPADASHRPRGHGPRSRATRFLVGGIDDANFTRGLAQRAAAGVEDALARLVAVSRASPFPSNRVAFLFVFRFTYWPLEDLLAPLQAYFENWAGINCPGASGLGRRSCGACACAPGRGRSRWPCAAQGSLCAPPRGCRASSAAKR